MNATDADLNRAIKQQTDRRSQAARELEMSDAELTAAYASTASKMGAFFDPEFFGVPAIRERARVDATKPVDMAKAEYDAQLYREGIDASNSDV